MTMRAAGLVLLLLATLCASQKTKTAHLLVLKSLDKAEVVENEAVAVTINLFNVGKSAAVSIDIDDSMWGHSIKEITGSQTATLDRIQPGFNQTHRYVIAAPASGALSVGATKVTYNSDPVGQEGKAKVVYSNILPELPVLTRVEYTKRTTRHLKEWGVFILLALVPVGLPALMYVLAREKLRAADERSTTSKGKAPKKP
jgi:hypothetical protein